MLGLLPPHGQGLGVLVGGGGAQGGGRQLVRYRGVKLKIFIRNKKYFIVYENLNENKNVGCIKLLR